MSETPGKKTYFFVYFFSLATCCV